MGLNKGTGVERAAGHGFDRHASRDSTGRLVGYGGVTRDLTEPLRASDPFRLAIEAAPTAMIIVDDHGRVVLVNAQVEQLFGYQRGELIGQPIEMLVPERFRAGHPGLRAGFQATPEAPPMGARWELFGLCKDGTEVPVEIRLNPIQTPTGRFVLSSIVDIAERKHAERERERLLGELRTLNAELEERVQARTAELSATIKQRDVLLQEVHHRVKNNLQVISSLMNIQADALADGASREALRDCQARVEAIGLIHEKLYQSRDYARVPFSDYVWSLAANVFHATGISRQGVALQFAIEAVALAVDKAVPCGLILNELITNALKHAFPEGRTGTIRVELRRLDGEGVRLTVQDDGVGLPPGFGDRKVRSLGMTLIRLLATQLDASLEIESRGGACFRLTVPFGSLDG